MTKLGGMGRGWSKLLAVASGGAVLLAACGDDADPSDPSSSAGVSGIAGTAGAANTSTGGASGSATLGGSGGGGAVDGGSSSVGEVDGGKGGAGGVDGGKGGASEGGASEGGAGGTGDGQVSVPTPHWLVFNHTDGLYLYDLTKFPSATGLTQLEPYGAVHDSGWSPDGQRLITGGVGGVVLRDMSGAAPGEPQLLADCAASPVEHKPVFAWIGDGKSAVCVRQQKELVAFAPTTAAPSLDTIDDGVTAYSVAPAGNKVAFMNEVGVYVVSVDAGKVGNPQDLEAHLGPDVYFRNEFIWSPDGNYLAHMSGKGALYDLTSTPLVRHTLTNGSVSWVNFSPDSQFLAFTGTEARSSRDAFYLDVSNPAQRLDLSPGLGDSVEVTWGGWVSSAPHFAYSIWDSNASSGNAVQLAANDSESAANLPFSLDSTTTWLRGSRRIVSNVGGSLAVLDLANPSTEPVPLVTPLSTNYQVAATSKVLAYVRNSHVLGVVNVDKPTEKSELTINAGVDSGIPSWRLSPDGGFVVAIDRYLGSRTLKLMKLDGGQSSAPVALVQKASNSESAYSFQRTH